MRMSLRFGNVFRAGVVLSLIAGLPVSAQGKSGGGHGASGREHGKGSKGSTMEGPKKTPDQMFEKDTKLSTKLQDLLAPGTDLQLAAAGFKNLGQFVAAVHVSRNLGIPFDQLKAQMVDNKLSLGAAIQVLKPTVDAEEEAEKGEDQADEEL